VFTVLVACGLGLPMPEDIALIAGGYMAGIGPPKGVGSLPLMILVGLVGILVGDSIIFRAGDHYGDTLLETRLGKHIPAARVERTRQLFAKHGPKMIMVARFLPGIRAVTYFVAGSSRVPYWKFLTYDGIAACASAPLWVLLGHWAGKNHAKTRAFAAAKHVQLGILAVVAGALVAWLVWLLIKRQRARAREGQRLLEATTTEPPSIQRNGAHGAEVPAPASGPRQPENI
jgi:membrane protein DedA with SNARE-associated domain